MLVLDAKRSRFGGALAPSAGRRVVLQLKYPPSIQSDHFWIGTFSGCSARKAL